MDMSEYFKVFDVGLPQNFSKQIKYTHFQGALHARLDQVYVLIELLDYLTDYQVKPLCFSACCLAKVNVGNKGKRGTKFSWNRLKWDARLLKDEEFVHEVKNLPENELHSVNANYFKGWERSKEQVSDIETSCKICFAEPAEEAKLQRSLDTLVEAKWQCPGKKTDISLV